MPLYGSPRPVAGRIPAELAAALAVHSRAVYQENDVILETLLT